VDRAIVAEPDKSSIRSMGFTEDGRSVYIISGNTFSYCYDVKSANWHERRSAGQSRWNRSCHAFFNGQVLFGDSTQPKIYRSSKDLTDEAGDPIIWQIQIPPISGWPRGFKVNELSVDMVSGVGTTLGPSTDTNPELLIDYTKDGGVSWASTRRCPLGAAGQRQTRVQEHAFGRFDHNGVTFRFTCSANVKKALQQIAIDISPLR
jgi:hypothetical protein